MESSSPSGSSPEQPSHKLAEIAGTCIALLTLTLPLFAIAHYSADRFGDFQRSPYSIQRFAD
ncbi:MAG: hypothetical protein HC925_04280 [Coleofasciculaceae cyanobacterium SM2_3_26]|nr:hypothetical protein [Coleofasciculaceae cyanobacterium SM2_3_26]